jgi:hypothetical protein
MEGLEQDGRCGKEEKSWTGARNPMKNTAKSSIQKLWL